MDNRRRRFIKNVTAATAGVTLGSMAFGNSSVNAFSRKANGDKDKQPEAQFPFYPYVKKYNFGDYLPKDQGGKFIQMQLIDSEDDHVIVKAIRNGLLQRVYGIPLVGESWKRRSWRKVCGSTAFTTCRLLPGFITCREMRVTWRT
ncbi:twin-arginine translocation signal domain-containing protein [Prolixibacter bellariivorans]|uniref:twin-arginine translocation signal domain-containing protein n=1 Tax=Prolixibacter bellariivorans TaxID=314319 RepID=UPI0011DE0CC2|nr:twin-arginine translocation signal domain-containing protein [Prolixibacter bellariivorans]